MIYLINLESTSLYKIGRTKDIKKRMKQLQTGASFPLILIHEFSTGDEESKLEKTIHRAFAHYKTQGEWFDFDLIEIEQVKAIILGLQDGVKIILNPLF